MLPIPKGFQLWLCFTGLIGLTPIFSRFLKLWVSGGSLELTEILKTADLFVVCIVVAGDAFGRLLRSLPGNGIDPQRDAWRERMLSWVCGLFGIILTAAVALPHAQSDGIHASDLAAWPGLIWYGATLVISACSFVAAEHAAELAPPGGHPPAQAPPA